MSDELSYREVFRRNRAAFHGRPKVVLDSPEVACDVCACIGRCVGFDTSDEEYGPFWICRVCAENAFGGELT